MMINSNNTPFNVSGLISFQDTTKQSKPLLPTIDLSKQLNQGDSLNRTLFISNTLSEQNIDSIFKRHEERELQYQQEMRLLQLKRWTPRIDTAKLFYNNLGFYNQTLVRNLTEDPFQQNVLLNIPKTKKIVETKSKQVFVSSGGERDSQQRYYTEKSIAVKPVSDRYGLDYDWITWILILSFILLGWIRLFFNNQFTSIVRSMFSYQESSSLFRERNSIIDRVFLLLNFLFLVVTSVFALQIAHFYNLGVEHGRHHLLYGIVFISLSALFLFRYFSSSFIGVVFLKKNIFSEYIHNVNIYTMSTGVFLLPVIILLQYLRFEYLGFMIYMGIGGIVLLYVSQLLRSFQIIIRKNVSIFYMILYLCAFEFAPFLIVYKLLLSLN